MKGQQETVMNQQLDMKISWLSLMLRYKSQKVLSFTLHPYCGMIGSQKSKLKLQAQMLSLTIFHDNICMDQLFHL